MHCYLETIKKRIKELDTDHHHPPLEQQQQFVMEEESIPTKDIPSSLEQSLQEARQRIHKTLLHLFQISTSPIDDWHSLLNNGIRAPTDSNWSRLPDEQATFIITLVSQLYTILTFIYNSESVFVLDLSKLVLWYNGSKSVGLQIEKDKTEFAISCGLVHYSLDRLFARTTGNILTALSCPNQLEERKGDGMCPLLTEYINNYIDKWNKFNDDCLRNPFLQSD